MQWGSTLIGDRMAEFLRVTLEDGTTVLFQNPEGDLVSRRGGPPEIETVDPGLARLETLAHAAATVCRSLRSHLGPDEICLELGAGLSGEVGWFFAKSSLDASIKISLTWKKPDDPAPQIRPKQ